jgi:hypothetical protein
LSTLASNCHPSISASQVAGITGMSHGAWHSELAFQELSKDFLNKLLQISCLLPQWPIWSCSSWLFILTCLYSALHCFSAFMKKPSHLFAVVSSHRKYLFFHVWTEPGLEDNVLTCLSALLCICFGHWGWAWPLWYLGEFLKQLYL